MKKLSLLAVALGLMVGSAQAATVNDSFRVTIEIRETCSLDVAAADVDFGQVDRSVVGNTDAGSTLQVTCTPGTPWVLGLDNGVNASSPTVSATNRRMTNGTSFVAYGLFRDAGRSQLFGGTAGTDTVSNTGTGSAQSVPVYGRVPGSSTNVAAGSYEDTVVALVTY